MTRNYGTLRDISDEEFKRILCESNCIREAAEKMGYTKINGGTYRMFRERIAKLNLDISHFYGENYTKRKYTDEEVFCENSKYNVRNRVIRYNLVPYKCAICENDGFWRNKKLTLILDHINGNHFDNRLDNLRFVCPNCESQLDTHGSKNKVKYYTSLVPPKKIYHCIDCGKKLKYGTQRCRECSNLARRKVQRPSKDELFSMIKTMTFVQIGKKYGVADRTVSKWCKLYGLPYRKKDINKHN